MYIQYIITKEGGGWSTFAINLKKTRAIKLMMMMRAILWASGWGERGGGGGNGQGSLEQVNFIPKLCKKKKKK